MPKCEICGSKHDPWQAHHFERQDVVQLPVPVTMPKVHRDLHPEVKAESVTKRVWRSKNKEKYNAYMREYMRKYRE